MKPVLKLFALLSLAGVAHAGLPEEGVQSAAGFYARASGGARWYSALEDRDRRPQGGTGNAADVFGELTLGLQTTSLLGIEFGVGGENSFTDIFVGPTLRIPVMGWGSRPVIHGFGLRYDYLTGNAVLNGYGTASSAAYSGSSSGSSSHGMGWTASYGVERMLGRRLSLGLQFSYQSVFYDQLVTVYNSGGFGGYSSYVRQLDLTGPRLALTLAFWPKAPYTTQADRDYAVRRQELRRRKLAEKNARRRQDFAPPPVEVTVNNGPFEAAPVDSPFATAAAAVTYGEQQLQAGHYPAAASAFSIATRMDASSFQAWRMLGRVNYVQGNKGAALQAYSQALKLEPADAKLRAFVETVRQEVLKEVP